MRIYSAVFAFAVGLPVVAQNQPRSMEEALLTEVRQLRLALERSNVTLPRVQIVLQRISLQQGRVDRLSVKFQDLRARAMTAKNENDRLADEVKVAESRMTQEQDPGRRKDMELRIQSVKEHLERSAASDAGWRTEEVELSGELNSERAKLDELERQLKSLEDALAPPLKD